MPTLEEIKKRLRNQKPTLAARYNVKEIGVFGFFVRGTQEPRSDVDILVDFEEYPSLLEFVKLEDELTEHLGIKVDLVMKSGLKPRIGQRILQEVIYL